MVTIQVCAAIAVVGVVLAALATTPFRHVIACWLVVDEIKGVVMSLYVILVEGTDIEALDVFHTKVGSRLIY